METNQDSNKRIAKNTLMLYIRMFFTMAISLYTSRVIINTLGVTDYGIYGVVGGVISMFTFLNGAMSSATQRYINFDIGKHNNEHLKIVFKTAMQIHILIALFVLILGETVGLWFVSTQLVIPEERITAAMWVYQFSIIACMVTIISLPYTADIIAHEKMSAFAYISIIDVTLKLAIVYALTITPLDKLSFYAFLFLCIQLLDRLIYNIYCKKHFKEVNFSLKVDKELFKEMFSFAGWSLWGNIAGLLFSQGINILLNIFFGPTVNAARSIAVKVQGVIQGFIANIQIAMNPQITKSYALNDLNRMHNLMFASSKFCYYLLLIIILPLTIEANVILTTWLKIVPTHTVWFLRLMACIMLIDAIANPFVIGNQATGKVKVFQALVGGILLLIVPIAYVTLKFGVSPESVFIVHLIMAILAQITRLFLLSPMIQLSKMKYIKQVIIPIILVSIFSPIIPSILYINMEESLLSFIVITQVSIICTIITIYSVGINKTERQLIKSKISSITNKRLFAND